MGEGVLRIASRGSRLARVQVNECLRALRPVIPPALLVETVILDTPGDRDKHTPLGDPSVPDDFFTRDLDRALLDGRTDLTVHSAKDLPKALAPGLRLACLLPALDERDAVVYRRDRAPGAVPRAIGASSPRREVAIRARFPGAETRPLRGTIEERLAQLDRGDFDAVIVAACALARLGLADRIGDFLPWTTTPLQGHLAIVVRADAADWIERLKPLDFRLQLFAAPAAAAATGAAWSGDPHAPATLFTGTHPGPFARFGPLLHWPMIRLVPRPLPERQAALAARLDGCAGVLFASPFAARCFVDALFHWADARKLDGKRLLAVGPHTAEELERLGLRADLQAPDYGGLASLAARAQDAFRGRCFYPCSSAAPQPERARTLAVRGIEPVPEVFYENLEHRPGPLPERPFARVLFTSPSTVRSYFKQYPDEVRSPRGWLAIGPSTLEALRELHLEGELIHEE